MAISKLQEIFASLENEHEGDGADDATVIESGEDTVENDLLAVQEAENEVEEANEIADELEDVQEGLESIAEFLEASLEEGGLDPKTAAAVNLAITSQTRRLGIENEMMPSMESFGGASSREDATRISMEAIKDTLKKIWEAIKSAVKKAIEALKNFFKHLFDASGKIIKRCEALEKSVGSVAVKKDAKVKVPGADLLHVDGKVDVVSIKSGLDNTKRAVDFMVGDYANFAVGIYTNFATLGKKTKNEDSEEKLDESIEEVVAMNPNFLKAIEAITEATLSGDRYFRMPESDGKPSVSGLVRGSLFAPRLAAKGTKVEAKEIDALSPADMKAILGTVKDIAKKIKDKKSVAEKADKARSETVKVFDAIVSESEKGRLGKAWSKAKLRYGMSLVNRDMLVPVNQTTAHAMRVSKAAINLVERSLKAHGKGGKEEGQAAAGSAEA